MQMQAIPLIQKTREYLDYVERHIRNVEKAWAEIQEKCKDLPVIYDDCRFHALNAEVEAHDVSKLGPEEFVQYRRAFYRTEEELIADGGVRHDLGGAWGHHKISNPHHWENWTKRGNGGPYESEIHCTHMVIDWHAMSMEFGDTAREYYEKNKDKIDLPGWAVGYINQIFDRLYGAAAGDSCPPEETS